MSESGAKEDKPLKIHKRPKDDDSDDDGTINKSNEQKKTKEELEAEEKKKNDEAEAIRKELEAEAKKKDGQDQKPELKADDVDQHKDHKIKTGVDGDHKIVIIDDLNDEEKRDLFKGPKRLLFGSSMNQRTNTIKLATHPLFELKKAKGNKDDEKVNWDDVVVPNVDRTVRIYESYSALQEAMTKNNYVDVNVQVAVAGMGGASVDASYFQQKEQINTKTSIYFTASSIILKGELMVNELSAKYSDNFMKDLNQLLETETKYSDKVQDFLNKYGQYYVSHAEIGGMADVTIMKTVEKTQERNQMKASVETTFKRTLAGSSVKIGASAGTEEDKTRTEINEESMQTLNARGGLVTAADPQDFSQWEKSVNDSYKLWAVINILEVQPFYYLLEDEEKKAKIKKMIKPQYTYHWSRKIGGSGGDEMTGNWDEHDTKPITAIRVKQTDYIGAISVKWEGKNDWSPWQGGAEGEVKSYECAEGEYFVNVQAKAGGLVDRLHFITNRPQSRLSDGWGGDKNKGDPIWILPEKDESHILCGIKGKCGGSVDSLRFLWGKRTD